MTLLRALFPSWKLFDEVGFVHELMVRVRTPDGAVSEWQASPSFPKRTPFSLFLNPAGNFRHAENSLVESLVQELRLNDGRDVPSQPAFEMVRLLACRRARDVALEASHYQFALSLKRIGDEERLLEETLVSPEYEMPHG